MISIDLNADIPFAGKATLTTARPRHQHPL
jgi:hypothetical protein